MDDVKEVVRWIRKIRLQYNIPKNKKLILQVKHDESGKFINNPLKDMIIKLANLEKIEIVEK